MGAETGSSRHSLMVACEGDWGLPCEFEEQVKVTVQVREKEAAA